MVQELEEPGRRAGPVCMGWMWLPPQGCAERRKGRQAGIRAPGAGSQRGAVAGGVWFCFQKHSSGLAATFKDLKIWKQASGKRSAERGSSEWGSAEPRAPAAALRSLTVYGKRIASSALPRACRPPAGSRCLLPNVFTPDSPASAAYTLQMLRGPVGKVAVMHSGYGFLQHDFSRPHLHQVLELRDELKLTV